MNNYSLYINHYSLYIVHYSLYIIHYTFAILMMLAKTPAAVTLAPAP